MSEAGDTLLGASDTPSARRPEAPDVPWWSPVSHLPALDKRVLVRWRDAHGVRVLEAARTWCKDAGQVLWLTMHKGRAIWLPPVRGRPANPERPWDGYHGLRGDAPELWRPHDLATWPEALPPPDWLEPAPGSPRALKPGRMWSSTTRFKAVEEAEAAEPSIETMSAAELAAGIADMREDAHARHRSGRGKRREPDEAPERPWWLDAIAVTYSEPGAISRREAEGRVMRALATERWERWERPTCPTFSNVLSRLIRSVPGSADDLTAALAGGLWRFDPAGRDRDDLATVATWCRAISCLREATPPRAAGAQAGPAGFGPSGPGAGAGRLARDPWERARLVLEARSELPPRSWRLTAKHAGCSAEGARQIYKRVHEELWAAANGFATAGTERAARALELVRESNRAFKRASLLAASDTRSARRPEAAEGPALGELALTGLRLTRRQRRRIAKRAQTWGAIVQDDLEAAALKTERGRAEAKERQQRLAEIKRLRDAAEAWAWAKYKERDGGK